MCWVGQQGTNTSRLYLPAPLSPSPPPVAEEPETGQGRLRSPHSALHAHEPAGKDSGSGGAT